jgi:hypothetical protein
MARKRIKQGEPIPVKLRSRDRELIDKLTFVDPDYSSRLHSMSRSRDLLGHFTLDELEDLLGCIAAEANHTPNRQYETELDSLHERLQEIMEGHDDGLWQNPAL